MSQPTVTQGIRGFVEPAYGRRSLGDVLPAVAAALGADAGFPAVGLELPPAPSYVVMLVDGSSSPTAGNPASTPSAAATAGSTSPRDRRP